MTVTEQGDREQLITRLVQPGEVGDAAVFPAASPIITGRAFSAGGGLVFW